jgi:two-component system, OmpR family, sensor histidine kinase KdpD
MTTSALATRPASVLATLEAYAGTLLMIGGSTLLGLGVAPRWGTASVDMIYLPAVLAAAALWGIGPGVVGGIGAALAYNFFFTEPVHTFRIDRGADVVTVAVLLIVALVTSRLAASIRAQARIAADHSSRNATIAGFAGKLLSAGSEADIADTACAQLRRLFDCNALLVAGVPEPRVVGSDPAGHRPTPSDVAAAALALESGLPAGRGTPRLQPAEWVFYPIRSASGTLAAVGLARDDGGVPVSEERLALLGNLLDQLALALERERLEQETRGFAATRQRDRIRLSLLSSIGDDLTPRLAAISGAVRQLKRDAAADKETVATIASEVVKLDRYVANLVELGPEGDQQPIDAGPVSIDLFRRLVTKNRDQVHLTPKEYAVLAELAKHRGRVLSHAHLLRSVWGPAHEGQIDYLRVAVRALRQKLEVQPSHPRLIVNEPGVGYRLIVA